MNLPFLKKSRAVNRARFTPSIRSFSAAETSRILQPWIWDSGFDNQSVSFALTTIRARSREMAKNSQHFARWLSLFVDNVVGDAGFTLIPKPSTVGDDRAIDSEAASFLKLHFWRWCNSPDFADVTGRKTFGAICRLVAENWARDGEAVVLVVKARNKYGISLRVIRPDALDEMANGATGSGNILRNGVEIDKRTLRPVAYHFRMSAEDSPSTSSAERIRVPASDILHVFTQHDETQTRGIPLGHPSLKKLKMLDEFDLAELVAARDEANTTGIFTAPAGREDEIAALNEDAETCTELCAPSEGGQKLVLPQGWQYDTKTPQHPNREVSSYKNSLLRDVASGLNVEYANFANDWAGVSFSSVRVGTLSERDHWKAMQAQMIEQFVSPVFRAWLRSFLKLEASGKYREEDFERLSDHEFRGRRWEWVDPMKDVNAATVAVEHGWKTDEQIASDYGGDLPDNLIAQANAKAMRERLGLREPLIAGAANPADQDGQQQDSDDGADANAEKI